MVRPRGELPTELSASLRSFDITQAELNFNTCLLVLEVGDERELRANTGVLLQILR